MGISRTCYKLLTSYLANRCRTTNTGGSRGQPGHVPPPKAQEGSIMSFGSTKKSSKKRYFFESEYGSIQKIMGYIRAVFSFGGILGWDPRLEPRAKLPPPP